MYIHFLNKELGNIQQLFSEKKKFMRKDLETPFTTFGLCFLFPEVTLNHQDLKLLKEFVA